MEERRRRGGRGRVGARGGGARREGGEGAGGGGDRRPWRRSEGERGEPRRGGEEERRQGELERREARVGERGRRERERGDGQVGPEGWVGATRVGFDWGRLSGSGQGVLRAWVQCVCWVCLGLGSGGELV